ncbi:Flp family type IVb pilin [Burkholderia ubonensis]|uniref:Flp family type IVb pilin n=1 Tax=Burkholderia ubonensis TaxID=101571 RepID=A0AB74DFI1_9BURK|nr:Flp family type IVb pilin [Burkholderia ubonensis]PAJ79015.1 Flp family type IVb pilin [Burkholderia ubonensis]PAJ90255.1 Flp family type IVb pilin [Burkholderia ubonensis]PAJ96608.1 Flp family type IVb pilin [Burkholderia ubonensis]PAK03169.1 Flp family type IVb pilin [Burkholderia ubonensis]PAK07793.1 Flp family type IVb pilin [Burkholderia ubonensis]
MRTGIKAVARWIDDRRGVTAIEYALLASLIAMAIVVAVATLGTTLDGVYQDVAARITAAT